MVIWPKRTPIRTFGADDAQFGATRQEQWLYSGTIHNALLTCVYFRLRYKRGSDDMAETNISRRRLLAATRGALMGGSMGKSVAATLDWNMAWPSEAGFSDDLNARLDKAIADKRIWNMHAVIVVRGGRLVLERYFDGEDNARGKPLGVVRFGPDTLHDLRSVSKSIVGLLYGIALAAGKVPSPEQPLMQSFPEYADLAADPARQRWTLHHVLSMTMGTDWDEQSIPYTNPANSEIAMDRAPDRYRYVLERPIVMEPGQRWTYCGGAAALLGRIIAKGTGKSLHDYAREVLFDPLGMGATDWYSGRDGELIAASAFACCRAISPGSASSCCAAACGTTARCCPRNGSRDARRRWFRSTRIVITAISGISGGASSSGTLRATEASGSISCRRATSSSSRRRAITTRRINGCRHCASCARSCCRRSCKPQDAPMRMPPPSTMTPPSTTWNTALRNGVSM